MIDNRVILGLNESDKEELINLMEGMPSDVKTTVFINLPRGYLNRKTFVLHESAPLRKYVTLDKNLECKTVKDPDQAEFQQEFCIITDKLDSLSKEFPNFVNVKLDQILRSESFNIKTVINNEVEIGNLFQACITEHCEELCPKIAHILNTIILPYKFRVYDFYNYMALSSTGMNKDEISYLEKLNQLINIAIVNNPEFNLPGFIYNFYKQLGITDCIEKYHFFDRFKYDLIYYGNSDTDILNILSSINELIANKSNSVDSSVLFNGSIFTSELEIDDEDDIQQVSCDFKKYDGMILSFKDIKYFDDMEFIPEEIRRLTKSEIIRYLVSYNSKNGEENDISESDITFELLDNDIGHLNHLKKIEIGTAYDIFNHNMYTLAYFNKDFYLLFKLIYKSREIYGIGLNQIEEDGIINRNILDISESKKISYQYISEY